jgi:hypothetical protein
VTVHHIEMQEIPAAAEDFLDLAIKLREVGRED